MVLQKILILLTLLTITPKERDILVECIRETRDALLKQQEELKQKQFES